jgi:hypothetical protein
MPVLAATTEIWWLFILHKKLLSFIIIGKALLTKYEEMRPERPLVEL